MLAFTCGTVSSVVLQRHLLTPEQGGHVQHLVALKVSELFGTAAVVSAILRAPRARAPLTWADVAVLVVCAVSWFLVEPCAAYAGTTMAGAWFLARHKADRQLVDIAQIWLTLSFCELWGKLAFRLAYDVIEPLEVKFMIWIGNLFYPCISSHGLYISAQPDWSIVILEGCSSFHNLSLAALIWLCVLKIADQRLNFVSVGALAISSALVITVNVMRILLMLPSYEAYQRWHDGQGASAFSLMTVLFSVAPIAVCVGSKVASVKGSRLTAGSVVFGA